MFLPYAALKVIVDCKYKVIHFFVVFGTSLPHFFCFGKAERGDSG